MSKKKTSNKNTTSQTEKVDQYAYVEINKRKRLYVYIGLIVSCGIYGLFMFEKMKLELTWTTIVVPTLIVGFLSTLIPMEERWIYKPWQKAPQKNEATKLTKPYTKMGIW